MEGDSLSTMWVLGIEPRPLGLMANASKLSHLTGSWGSPWHSSLNLVKARNSCYVDKFWGPPSPQHSLLSFPASSHLGSVACLFFLTCCGVVSILQAHIPLSSPQMFVFNMAGGAGA